MVQPVNKCFVVGQKGKLVNNYELNVFCYSK